MHVHLHFVAYSVARRSVAAQAGRTVMWLWLQSLLHLCQQVSNLVIKEFEFLFNVLKKDLVFELEIETPPPPPPPEPEPIEADVRGERPQAERKC